ncbi:glycine-rich domain-containing protein [Chryseobacterium wanjuense]
METKMLLQNDSLWSRLQEFSLDTPNVDFPFSKKLAKEEKWTLDFTKKAIEEYKKFVYLCCILPNGASPSEIVDKVWHMHLIYTQNYWEEFCPNILQRKLHHHPSKGGFAEKEKHQNWFSDTLKSYREIFQQEAPEEIWKEKPKMKSWLKRIAVFSPLIILLLMYSCSDGEGFTSVLVTAVIFTGIFIFGIIESIMGDNEASDPHKKDKDNNDGGGCSGGSSGCSGGGGCGGGCGGCGGCGG